MDAETPQNASAEPRPMYIGEGRIRLEVTSHEALGELLPSFRALRVPVSLPSILPTPASGPFTAILFFSLQNIGTIADALQIASVMKEWWASSLRREVTPQARLFYQDEGRVIEIELKGVGLDVNKLAETFLKQATKLKSK